MTARGLPETTLDFARVYLASGFVPVPVPTRAKKPLISEWQHFRPSEESLTMHFCNDPNVGLLLGEPSGGLVDVDLDVAEAVALAGDFLPGTAMRSGRPTRPGSHRWFVTSGPVTTHRFQDPARETLVELRSTGGQTVVPPSIHPDGEPYRWEGPLDPAKVTGDDLERRVRRLAAATLICRHWPRRPGCRHDIANAIAGMLVRGSWDEAEVRSFVESVARVAGDEESAARARAAMATVRAHRDGKATTGTPTLEGLLGEPIVARIREWLQLPASSHGLHIKAGAAAFEDRFSWTDAGNADRLVQKLDGAGLYVHSWGRWLLWDGRRWAIDDTDEIVRRARQTVAELLEGALRLEDQETRKRLFSFGLRSEHTSRLKAMVELARADEAVAITHQALDRDPWLLTVENGTIDLRTGCMRDHDRGDLITKLVPVAFDPDASCPTWLTFLNRIFAGDAGLIDYLQGAIGYTLTASIREQVLFLCHGTGANGKSTLLETLRTLLADYARQASFETFLVKREGGIPNDVARLFGARLVTASEADAGKRLSESLVKSLTGGDEIAARFLRQEFFEFKPTFKIWLAANHKPAIYGTDHAIWRRIKLIPFNVTIPDEEQDRDLPAKLEAELSGILRWAVEGCVAWHRDGLQDADAVSEATRAYRDEEDVLEAFLDDRCVLEPYAHASAAELFRAYRTWADENGGPDLTQKKFASVLRERSEGLTSGKRGGRRIWTGIGLRDGGAP